MKRWSPWRYDADQDDESNKDVVRRHLAQAVVRSRREGDADRLTSSDVLKLVFGLAMLTFAGWLWSQ